MTWESVLNTIVSYLWENSWQIALLVGVVWIVSRLTRRAPARWHYLLWMLVLVKVFLPPTVHSPTSLRSLFEWEILSVTTISETVTLGPVERVQPLQEAKAASGAPIAFAGEMGNVEGRPSLPALLCVFVWLTGLGTVLVRYLICSARSFRTVKRSSPFSFGDEFSRAGLRDLRIRTISGEGSPFVTGIFSPLILVPEKFLESTSHETLRLAILHETEHIRRHDGVWNLLIVLAKSIFWFHPLAHYGLQRFCDSREMLVDEKVLVSTGEESNRVYNDLILSLLENHVPRSARATAMSACSLPGLKERVRRIGEFDPKLMRFRLHHLVGFLLVAAVAVPLGELRLEARTAKLERNGMDGEASPVSAGTPDVEIEARWIQLEYDNERDREIAGAVNEALGLGQERPRRGDSVETRIHSGAMDRQQGRALIEALSEIADVQALTFPKVSVGSGETADIRMANASFPGLPNPAGDVFPATSVGPRSLDLTVTPIVKVDGAIDLTVSPVIRTAGESLIVFDAQGNPLEGPPIFPTHSAATRMTVDDGGMVLVGGLKRETEMTESEPDADGNQTVEVAVRQNLILVSARRAATDPIPTAAETHDATSQTGHETTRALQGAQISLPDSGGKETAPVKESTGPSALVSGSTPVVELEFRLIDLRYDVSQVYGLEITLENLLAVPGNLPFRGGVDTRPIVSLFVPDAESISKMLSQFMDVRTTGPFETRLASGSWGGVRIEQVDQDDDLPLVGTIVHATPTIVEDGSVQLDLMFFVGILGQEVTLFDAEGNPMVAREIKDPKALPVKETVKVGHTFLFGGNRFEIDGLDYPREGIVTKTGDEIVRRFLFSVTPRISGDE